MNEFTESVSLKMKYETCLRGPVDTGNSTHTISSVKKKRKMELQTSMERYRGEKMMKKSERGIQLNESPSES